MEAKIKRTPMNFDTMAQADVPQGRKGKHNKIISNILSDLDKLPAGAALKVPLSELEESKANVRSALNRAINKGQLRVATASDDNFLYVWNESDQK
jgi:hypothetical protein